MGATTRTGLVAAPLRDRFGFIGQLDLYDVAELTVIVERSAALLDVSIAEDAAAIIAGRSRGTPRIANRLLRRVRDFAAVQGHRVVDTEVAVEALDLFGVDEYGLATIEDAYEPYLLREGLLIRTPRGRVATERAFEHMGIRPRGGGLV